MKKNIFLALTMVFSLTACHEDFNADWADVNHTPDNSKVELQTVNVDVKALAERIEMENEKDSVTVFEPVKVESSLQPEYVLEMTNQEGTKTVMLPVTMQGKVSKSELVAAVETLYGKRQEERTIKCRLIAYAVCEGTKTKTSSAPFTLVVWPEIPPINYWMWGKQNNGDNENRTLPLMPVTAALQTVTTYFGGVRDTKVVTDDYFATKSTDYVYGVTGSQATTETGEVRAGGGGYISAPKAGWYTLSFDFANYTYSFNKLENQSPVEYASIGLIGLGGDWDNDILMTEVETNKSAWRSHCWYVHDLIVATDTEGKFRADGAWTANWGTSAGLSKTGYGKGEKDGANISIPAGTYDVYFNDITGEFLFLAK